MPEPENEQQLAHYGATAMSPQDTSLWGRMKESFRLATSDIPSAGLNTMSALTPMSEWYDENVPSFMNVFTGGSNPFPKTRGEELGQLANTAIAVGGGMAGAAEGKLNRLANLDEISNMTRNAPLDVSPLEANYPRASPQGQVGRYGSDVAKRIPPKPPAPSPLNQNTEVPLSQLGGEAKQAVIDVLRQLL